MSESKTNTGIGFVGLLQIVFITLKLLGVITWTWFWVLSPIIFNIGLAVIIIAILILMKD